MVAGFFESQCCWEDKASRQVPGGRDTESTSEGPQVKETFQEGSQRLSLPLYPCSLISRLEGMGEVPEQRMKSYFPTQWFTGVIVFYKGTELLLFITPSSGRQ